MRLYLDACCLNRPFDDQLQTRVHLESEAVLAIGEWAEQGRWTILSSEALEFELARTQDSQRRARTQKLLLIAQERVSIGSDEITRAETLCRLYGLSALDSLHLACAEAARADVFLTTDDRLLRACRRMSVGDISFIVANPLPWLTEFLECR